MHMTPDKMSSVTSVSREHRSSKDGKTSSRSECRHVDKKRRHSSSSSDSSSSGSSESDSSTERRRKKRRKKRLLKKEKKRLKKHKKKMKKKQKKLVASGRATSPATTEENSTIGPALPDRGVGQAMRPMTLEEWQKQNSELRHVIDPQTGRKRLIRGTGEIVEEIVSSQRHREINKMATEQDGVHFQHTLSKIVNK